MLKEHNRYLVVLELENFDTNVPMGLTVDATSPQEAAVSAIVDSIDSLGIGVRLKTTRGKLSVYALSNVQIRTTEATYTYFRQTLVHTELFDLSREVSNDTH